MTKEDLVSKFELDLKFLLTKGQRRFVDHAFAFMESKKPWCCLVISGYAGTGKTSMVSQLLRNIAYWNYTPVLLAPTGKAAKVVERMSKVPANTIHRYIYKVEEEDDDFRFEIRKNTLKKGLYIIDEASMIGDVQESLSGGSLLADLFEFIFQQKGSKIILVGDEGQLPPVGLDHSPALNLENLKSLWDIPIAKVRLTEVVRQSLESGILSNATSLRSEAPVQLATSPDFEVVTANDFPDSLDTAYQKFGQEEVLVVCRSNKMAYKYNQHIRNQLLWYEEEVCPNEILMVVKNNYFWLKHNKKTGFIANGESITIHRILDHHQIGSFRFIEVEASLLGHEDQLNLMLWLDSLNHDGPNLPRETTRQLYQLVKRNIIIEKGRCTKSDLKKDPFVNALQVKYAYAVTCHKSQGGQWKKVYVDCGYYSPEPPDLEYRRWLYTAITRSVEECALIQPPQHFLAEPSW